MKIQTLFRILAVSGLALFLAHCGTNIFPSSDTNRKETADGCISLGMEAERDGDYETALDYYTTATELDSTLTDGWYLKAKMELRTKGIRLPDLVGELINDNKKKLPFFPDSTIRGDTTLRTVLYYDSTLHAEAVFNITPLDTMYDRLVKLFDPSIQAYNDLLHIFVGNATKGTYTKSKILSDFTMLSSLQTALLSLDNSPKDNSLSPGYNPYNKERVLYKVMGKGLKDIDHIEIDVDSIKALFDGPEDINGMVQDLIDAATVSLASINDWDAEIQASDAENIDKDMLKDPQEQMQTVIQKAGYYYYNDKKDNDGDYWDANKNDSVERMIWVDTNGNNKVDWVDPANPSIAFVPSDTFDRMRNDTSYRADTSLFGFRVLGDDKRYYFKGLNGGEFVAGDWGVDEEQLDDVENDGDKIGDTKDDGDKDDVKDEDSRISSDTLDQDADFIKIDTSNIAAIDSIFGSWQSGKRALNTHPTVKAGQVLTTARLGWIDLNSNGVIDGPTGTHLTRTEVINNYAAIVAAINGGTAYGEWFAGDWGIDEEYVDGLDNDGDGKYDEDGDVHLIHRPEWDPSRNGYMDLLKASIQRKDIRGTR